MDDKEFKELLKSLGIKDEKEDHKAIDKNLSQDEFKKRAAKIIFSIAQGED